MQSKNILDNFKRQLREKAKRQEKITNIIYTIITLSLLISFIYIFYKQTCVPYSIFL